MTSCDYYPLTECRKSPEDYYAMEFYSPEEKKGFFQVVANTQVKEPSFLVKLVLDESLTYQVENSSTGEIFIQSGKELVNGFELACEKRSGVVFFFEAVKQ